MFGKFIVIEGPDGAGTTTQSQSLAHTWKQAGEKVLWTAEPSDGFIGSFTRNSLSQKPLPDACSLQLLFCADRADHLATTIPPALQSGTDVICDRYSLSTLVYGQALGLSRAWLESLCSTFLQPDLTILLLPSFHVCQSRLGDRAQKDELEEESLAARVHQLYAQFTNSPRTILIDSSGSKEETQEKISAIIQSTFS